MLGPEPEIERFYSIELKVGDNQTVHAQFTRHGSLRGAGYNGSSPRFDDCYGALLAAGVVLGMKIKADLDACEGVTD